MSAALIAELIEAGTPAELVGKVAMELARAQAAAEILERRRTRDRERKRDVPRNSEESTEGAEILSPQSPPLKSTPDPEKISPPLTPQSGDSSAGPTAALTRREVIEAWQTRMVPLGFPAIRKLTAQRERQLKARLRDSTLEEWQRAMDALERSAFCRGENDRGWRADFDFLLQPKSFTKLLEGAYDH